MGYCCAATAKGRSRRCPRREVVSSSRVSRETFNACVRRAAISSWWRETTIVPSCFAQGEAPWRREWSLRVRARGLLHFDDDHAAGASAAVHRHGCGVLQDFDGLDVVRIDTRETPTGTRRDRYAVDDVQWLSIATAAADLDRQAAV